MSVLDRSELEASPLADLHSIADQLGMDGFRRLRKAELIDEILRRGDGDGDGDGGGESAATEPQSDDDAPPAGSASDGEGPTEDVEAAEEAPRPARARRGRRSRRGRGSGSEARETGDAEDDVQGYLDTNGDEAGAPAPSEPPDDRAERGERDERVIEGVVELLGNGSAFLRVDPPEPSDDDVYISSAQVRRCELVAGDRVSGPVRAPRRSERYASMARIDTINGAPAESVSAGTHYDDLPAAFPSERFAFGSEDATLRAIEWLAPLGYGSRAVIVGAARSGKTETLRRLAGALAGQDGLELTLVLAGVRPEEIGEWRAGPVAPVTELSLTASADAQGQAVERAVEAARRVAARGGNAVVLIDTLEALHPPVARKALAAARKLVDSGSLTVIATARHAFGGETTVIALDVALTSTARLPALDMVQSGTLRPELLVGDAGAEAIAAARATALTETRGDAA